MGIDKQKRKQEKQFQKYREALCYATNFRKIKRSEVFKEDTLVISFEY